MIRNTKYMGIIESIYMAAAIISMGACVPQIRRLILTKNSDGFSVPTWVMWAGTQVVTLAYVISIHAVLMIVVNIVWVTFYGTMTALIIHYRLRKHQVAPGVTDVDLVQAVVSQAE